MATNANASIRLRFFANDGPLRKAIGSMRSLAKAGGGAAKAFGGGAMAGLRGGGGFSKQAFAAGGHLAMASQGVRALRSDLQGLIQGPIEKFAEFDKTMAMAAGRFGSVTGAELEQARAAANELGRTTTLSAQQGAEGLYELAGAGLSVEEAIGALPAVGAMAEANMMGLGDATTIVADTMNQFGLGVKDMGMINDVLTAAANSSTINLSQMSETMTYLGTQANLATLSLEDTAAMAAVVGLGGIKASMAGTGLAMMLQQLASQTPGAVKALRSVGMSTKDMTEGVTNPIDFLQKLAGSFDKLGGGSSATAKKLKVLTQVFGQRAAKSAGVMLDKVSKIDPKTGVTGWMKIRGAIESSAGASERMVALMRESGAGKLQLFQSQVESLQIQLGEGLMPALSEIMKGVAPVMAQFADWAKQNPDTVASIAKFTIGSMALLAVLGPTLAVASTLVTVFGGLGVAARVVMSPVRMLGGGIGFVNTKLFNSGSKASKWGRNMTSAVGLASAAFAGWQLGSLLDEWIGKMFNLRKNAEGVASISGELGHIMGESAFLNDMMGQIAGVLGYGDTTEGNKARNSMVVTKTRGIDAEIDKTRTSDRALQKRGLPIDVAKQAASGAATARTTPPAGAPSAPAREDKLAVDVTVTDKRVTAKPSIKKATRPIDLRTQSAVP